MISTPPYDSNSQNLNNTPTAMETVAIIWPAYPYRGGIAHHTNQLADAFIKLGHKVSIFTFSRQYPRFLYPGKHQTEPAWTPSPLPESPNLSLQQLIDTINPLSWYRTTRAIIKQNPDYCLIKYWHPYFVPCFTFIVWLLRRKNIPVICIIDNLFPHERHFGDTLLTRILFTQISSAVTQSEIVHKQFQTSFPHISETIILHPVYDQFWLPVWQAEARRKLGISADKKLLLFFGFIRPYKGLDILLWIMPQLIKQYPSIHLLVAGECFGSFEVYQRIIDDLNLSQYITLHLRYISNTDIPNYFGACDLLVMPYRTMTNSGIENIGKIYAPRSLLTVWFTPAELIKSIWETFSVDFKIQQDNLSWEAYVNKIENFAQ